MRLIKKYLNQVLRIDVHDIVSEILLDVMNLYLQAFDKRRFVILRNKSIENVMWRFLFLANRLRESDPSDISEHTD